MPLFCSKTEIITKENVNGIRLLFHKNDKCTNDRQTES